MFQSFGFCGSRFLSRACWSTCRTLAAAVAGFGGEVLTGCAPGADAAARAGAGPACQVFYASGASRSALARRSKAMVQALSRALDPVLVCFAQRPCPAVLRPSASSSACFCGTGSGTWASAALAAGLGVPVVVFSFPASLLPQWPGGCWSPVASGLLAGGYRFCFSQYQLSLF